LFYPVLDRLIRRLYRAQARNWIDHCQVLVPETP
jgi:hypothetical protein